MKISVVCPSCFTRYQLNPELKGQNLVCPNAVCRAVFEVVEEVAQPPEPVAYAVQAEMPPAEAVPQSLSKKLERHAQSEIVPISEPRTPAPTEAAGPKRVASWHEPPPIRRSGSTSTAAPAGATEPAAREQRPAGTANGPQWQSSAPEIDPELIDKSPDAPARAHIPPDSIPSDPDLDSPKPPSRRNRKALIVGLLLGIFLIGGGAGTFLFVAYRQTESSLYAQALKDYKDRRFTSADDDFANLVKDFPNSKERPLYRFMGELAHTHAYVDSPGAADPVQMLARFRQFLAEGDNAKFLHDENAKEAGPLLQNFAGILADMAEEHHDPAFLKEARNAFAESTGKPGSEDKSAALQAKLFDTEKKLVLWEMKNKLLAKKVAVISAGATMEKSEAWWREAKDLGLGGDSDILAGVKEIRESARQAIRYEVARNPPPRGLTHLEHAEPSVLITHVTSKPTPLTGVKRVVVALVRGVLYALDEGNGGEPLWWIRVGIDTTALPVRLPATSASPELFLVLSADRNSIMALETDNGSPRWQHHLSAPCLGRPVVVDQRVYVPTYDGKVHEIEISGGNLLGSFHLGQPLSGGGVWQEDTDLLYIPGYSDYVYVLDIARGQDPVKKRCVAILRTGHPSGSLRSEPLLYPKDPNVVMPAGEPWKGYLILSQSDGEHMKVRVFEIPVESSDSPPLQPDISIEGWSWFQPCHDPEKFVFVTDKGVVGLYGVRQWGNSDPAVFPMSRLPLKVVSAETGLSRGQVVHCQERDFWIAAGGELQRWYFDLFGQKLTACWPKPLALGAPLHAAQMDETNGILVMVTRDLPRQRTLATAIQVEDGTILWQRQLGLESQGDPLVLDKDSNKVLLANQNGSAILFEEGKLKQGPGPGTKVNDSQLVGPLEGVAETPFLLPYGDSVLEVASADKGRKLVVRKLGVNQQGGIEETSSVDVSSPLWGTPAIVDGALVVPLKEGIAYQYTLPLGSGKKEGFKWRTSRADDDSRGHILALEKDEFLITDGSRGLGHRQWPAASPDFKLIPIDKKPSREMPARIVAAPLKIPAASPGAEPRICVADKEDVISLLRGAALQTERSWKLPGKITSGPFLRGTHIGCVVNRNKLVWIDPDKDAILWEYSTGLDELVGQPLLLGDMIVVADQAGRFVGLDPANGSPRGRGRVLKAGAAPVATPFGLGKGTALVPLTDGTLFVLDLALLR